MVGVETPQSCGLRKTALEFVRQDEPTDAGALGTRKCVLFARVMELVDVPDSKSGPFEGCGFESRFGHILKDTNSNILSKYLGYFKMVFCG